MKLAFTKALLLGVVALQGAAAFAAPATDDKALHAAVNGDWRTDEAKARDKYRHPVESLTFWGLKPGMTILEIQPGSQSWWTDILAPYAKMTGGAFYATGADLANPKLSEGARKSRSSFEARYLTKPELYGDVRILNWGDVSKSLPADTFDFILTARSIHGWMQDEPNTVHDTFVEFHKALKKGGILAVEQHRAKAGTNPEKPATGLRHRGVRDRAGAEGRLHAGGQVRDQREPEGHDGSPVRRLDAAAEPALDTLRLGQGRGSDVRQEQVRSRSASRTG